MGEEKQLERGDTAGGEERQQGQRNWKDKRKGQDVQSHGASIT